MTDTKGVDKAGKSYVVAELEVIDHTGGHIKVSVGDKACEEVRAIPDGEGFTCVGSTALQETGEKSKLNIWPTAHVLRGGVPAQSLTRLDESSLDLELLTAVFAPTHEPINVEGEAHPSCAAALAEAVA